MLYKKLVAGFSLAMILGSCRLFAGESDDFISKFASQANLLYYNSGVCYQAYSELTSETMRILGINHGKTKQNHILRRNGDKALFAETIQYLDLRSDSAKVPQVFIDAYDGNSLRHNIMSGDALTSYAISKGSDPSGVLTQIADLHSLVIGDLPVHADGGITAGTGGMSLGFSSKDLFAEAYYKTIGFAAEPVSWEDTFRRNGVTIIASTPTRITVQVPTGSKTDWKASGLSEEQAEDRVASRYYIVNVDPTRNYRIVAAQRWVDGKLAIDLRDVVLKQDELSGIWYPQSYTEEVVGRRILKLEVTDFSAMETPLSAFTYLWLDGQKVFDRRDKKLYRFLREDRVQVSSEGKLSAVHNEPGENAITWSPETSLEIAIEKIDLLTSGNR